MATIILGAGIIGTSTAYYLSHSQSPSSIHLVDPSPSLFASASGFAAGFLAKDWFSPSVSGLASLSFTEHKKLAEENNGQEIWGYSKSMGTSYTARRGGKPDDRSKGEDWLRHGASRLEAASVGILAQVNETENHQPRWLRRIQGDKLEAISEEGTTAQVDPLRLSQFLLSQCLERGVQLHQPARAISIAKDVHDVLSSIRIESTDSNHEVDIPCTRLIITAGAWSPKVFEILFPSAEISLPISSLAGHSLVLRSPRWTKEDEKFGCHAIFTTEEVGYSPEIFSRMNGEIYVAGLNSSSMPLPALATESKIQAESIKQLLRTSRRLLSFDDDLDDLEIVRESLCFRPVTNRETPILARIPDVKLGGGTSTRGGGEGGVFLAAGHGPWGISMSLGTGKVMAEMVQGLPTSANIDGLTL